MNENMYEFQFKISNACLHKPLIVTWVHRTQRYICRAKNYSNGKNYISARKTQNEMEM